jgi:hypothetical protein
MTPHGLAFVLSRLSSAPDLAALRRVWESLSPEYQRHPDVRAMKDKLKETLK